MSHSYIAPTSGKYIIIYKRVVLKISRMLQGKYYHLEWERRDFKKPMSNNVSGALECCINTGVIKKYRHWNFTSFCLKWHAQDWIIYMTSGKSNIQSRYFLNSIWGVGIQHRASASAFNPTILSSVSLFSKPTIQFKSDIHVCRVH